MLKHHGHMTSVQAPRRCRRALGAPPRAVEVNISSPGLYANEEVKKQFKVYTNWIRGPGGEGMRHRGRRRTPSPSGSEKPAPSASSFAAPSGCSPGGLVWLGPPRALAPLRKAKRMGPTSGPRHLPASRACRGARLGAGLPVGSCSSCPGPSC